MNENGIVEDLQKQINELEDKVNKLNEVVRLLSKSKMPDPRYPYTHWLLYKGIDNELKRKLGYVFNILEERFKDEPVEIHKKSSFVDDDLKQILHVNQKPNFEQVGTILKSLLGSKCQSDTETSILLMCLLREGLHVELTTYLLVEASKNSNYASHNLSQFI